ncbi:DUF3299 domain-containing protein [Shimia sp. R11_0]|uniref:DUF3299 domain-containing protein n=1 Tax=Shimia sp. R11_0 TaxID=2821096 RepID=UPI001AD96EDD|nr:DUF3299 domain-containing protein [Shimia sp. R11_0]
MTASRRQFLRIALAAATLPLATRAWADEVLTLAWAELIPEGDTGQLLKQLRGIGVVQHGQLTTGFDQPEAKRVTKAFDGMMVRLPGFVVPLDFGASGVSEFILAPFVGACIHVPPPPANQLVLVTAQTPYDMRDLFDPVEVTGVFHSMATSTGLAEVGYSLQASKVKRYRG